MTDHWQPMGSEEFVKECSENPLRIGSICRRLWSSWLSQEGWPVHGIPGQKPEKIIGFFTAQAMCGKY